MDHRECSRCGWERTPGVPACARCGLEFPVVARLDLILRPVEEDVFNRHWRVSDDEVVVGRGESAGMDLGHDSVSRRHARIRRVGAEFVVEDLASRNWTLLNGERISGLTRIGDGDEITFGEVALQVELVEAPVAMLTAPFSEGPSTVMVEVDEALAAAFETPAPELSPVAPASAPEGPSHEDTPTIRLTGRGGAPGEAEGATPVEASEPGTEYLVGAPLADFVETAVGVTENLRLLNNRLYAVFELIEQAGGRAAIAGLIEQARRTEASPADVQELMALGERALTARRLLEAELALLDVLWPLIPTGKVGVAGEEAQRDRPYDQPVA